MKAKIKDSSRFHSEKESASGKRGYYFHADEDFREDWTWEKTKSAELPKRNTPEKKIT